MFGVINLEYVQKPSIITSIKKRVWTSRETGASRVSCGMSTFFIFTVELGHDLAHPASKRSVKRALNAAEAMGMRKLVLPRELYGMMEEYPMALPDLNDVYRRYLSRIISGYMRLKGIEKNEACLFFYGDWCGKQAAGEILELAKSVRAIKLSFMRSPADLPRLLYSEYGIAVSGPAPVGTEHVHVCFSKREIHEANVIDLSGRGIGISGAYYPEILCKRPEECGMPRGTDEGMFAAALLAEGGITASDIRFEWHVN